MKKIVVFGATGNLGAYISVHMKEQGYDVIAVGHRKNDNNFFADRGMSSTALILKTLKPLIFFRKMTYMLWRILRVHFPADMLSTPLICLKASLSAL